jgi:hypothetical protein
LCPTGQPVTVLVLVPRPAGTTFVATDLGRHLRRLSSHLQSKLNTPLADLQLTFPPAQVLTPGTEPFLDRHEAQTRQIRERIRTFGKELDSYRAIARTEPEAASAVGTWTAETEFPCPVRGGPFVGSAINQGRLLDGAPHEHAEAPAQTDVIISHSNTAIRALVRIASGMRDAGCGMRAGPLTCPRVTG